MAGPNILAKNLMRLSMSSEVNAVSEGISATDTVSTTSNKSAKMNGRNVTPLSDPKENNGILPKLAQKIIIPENIDPDVREVLLATKAALNSSAAREAEQVANEQNEKLKNILGVKDARLPELNPIQVLANIKNHPLLKGFDGGGVLRAAALQKGEIIAKLQRYPYMVHSEQKIKEAEGNFIKAQKEFTTNFFDYVKTHEDIMEALELFAGIMGIFAAGAGKGAAAFIAGAAALALYVNKGHRLIKKMGAKFDELVEPPIKAYNDLTQLRMENDQASYKRCQMENYQPKLEFDPSTVDKNKAFLIDKMNPNAKMVVIEMYD